MHVYMYTGTHIYTYIYLVLGYTTGSQEFGSHTGDAQVYLFAL